jgi:hypothetical protein
VAYSAQLSANARYVVQARDGAVFWRQGTAGSAQDASSTTGMEVPDTAAIDLYTRSGRYFSCDGSAESGKMYYNECQ